MCNLERLATFHTVSHEKASKCVAIIANSAYVAYSVKRQIGTYNFFVNFNSKFHLFLNLRFRFQVFYKFGHRKKTQNAKDM